MENEPFFEELKFGIGDGNLHYYLYNWKCPEIDAKKVYTHTYMHNALMSSSY